MAASPGEGPVAGGFRPDATPAPAIVAQGAVKDYPGVRAVDHASFTVRPGEIYGFFGPNGAGKTTTIRMLTGLTRPTFAGRLQVAGVDVARHPAAVRAHVAVLPEVNRPLEAVRGRAFLRFHGRMMGLAEAEVRRRIDRLEGFLELSGHVDKRFAEMSMGERQRLQIARVLMSDARVLFLDEPFNSIDAQARRRLRDHLRRVVEGGRTIFYTSHNLIEAEHLCDRFSFIVDGRIVSTGTADDLRHRHLARRFRLKVDRPGDAAAMLASRGLVQDHRMRDDDLQVTVPEEADEADLVDALVEEGFRVRALVPEGTMEDVLDVLAKGRRRGRDRDRDRWPGRSHGGEPGRGRDRDGLRDRPDADSGAPGGFTEVADGNGGEA